MKRASWTMLMALPLLHGCAAQTTYRGIPVAELSDEQLVEELYSAASGLGVEFNRTTYLMAVRPDPAYVLTSSTTNYTATTNATYNAYVMPTGYGAYVTGAASASSMGSSTTRYQYTDVNAAARLGNSIATAISRARQENYRRRGTEVYEEYERRVRAQRSATDRIIESFFTANPNLIPRRNLVTVVAPWAAAEGMQSPEAVLERTKALIEEMPRAADLGGAWYGTFSQTTTAQDGSIGSFSEFVRLILVQDGPRVVGRGFLGSGEVIELEGTLDGRRLEATVANTTSAINVTLAAITADGQVAGQFAGFGPGVRLEGTFTLLR